MEQKKEITGEIYSKSKDEKSINISGEWFRSFNKIEFSKGDIVKVLYKTRTLNGKVFNNIVKISLIETWNKKQEEDLSKSESKAIPCGEKVFLSPTDLNCCIMTAKDLFEIDIMTNDNPNSFEDWVERVKLIRLKL